MIFFSPLKWKLLLLALKQKLLIVLNQYFSIRKQLFEEGGGGGGGWLATLSTLSGSAPGREIKFVWVGGGGGGGGGGAGHVPRVHIPLHCNRSDG